MTSPFIELLGLPRDKHLLRILKLNIALFSANLDGAKFAFFLVAAVNCKRQQILIDDRRPVGPNEDLSAVIVLLKVPGHRSTSFSPPVMDARKVKQETLGHLAGNPPYWGLYKVVLRVGSQVCA